MLLLNKSNEDSFIQNSQSKHFYITIVV